MKAANGKRDGPLGILDPSLQADSYIITTYYTGAGFNEPDVSKYKLIVFNWLCWNFKKKILSGFFYSNL